MQQSCERLRHVVRAAEGQQSNGSPAHSKPPPQSDDGSGQQRERSRVVGLRCVQSVILGPCRRTSGRQAPILRLAWTNRILYRNRGSAALPGRPQRATLFPSLPWCPQCTRSPGCLPETPPFGHWKPPRLASVCNGQGPAASSAARHELVREHTEGDSLPWASVTERRAGSSP